MQLPQTQLVWSHASHNEHIAHAYWGWVDGRGLIFDPHTKWCLLSCQLVNCEIKKRPIPLAIMSTNTPEYRAMIQSTSDLTNAVKLDIGPLSEELLSQGLIAADNQAAAINQMIDVGQRASQLVSLVRTRIQLNPSNFHKFVRVLLKRASVHRDILEILDNKYKALGTHIMCVYMCICFEGGG